VHPRVGDRLGRGGEEVTLMGEAVVDPERLQHRVVPEGNTREEHPGAAALELLDGVAQHRRPGRVQGRDPRHAQDHHPDIAELTELEQGMVGPTEEERTVEPIGDDVLVHQRSRLVVGVRALDRDLDKLGRLRERAEGERARSDDAEQHGGDEVDDDGREGDEADHDPLAPRGAQQGPEAGHLDHADGGGDEDPCQGGEGDVADDRTEREDHHEQCDGVDDRGQP